MKTSYIAAAAMVLAMLSCPAFAQNAASPGAPAGGSSQGTGAPAGAAGSGGAGGAGAAAGTEAPGMKELGVDISKAGSSSQENQSFLKSLPADRQAKIKDACKAELQQPTASQRPMISTFCKNLQSAQ